MPDERIWELKLQHVSEQIGSLSKQVDDKLSGLAEVLKSVNENFVKILDDHEGRLRKQAEVDSNQASEISQLREKMAWFGGELTAVKVIMEKIDKKQEERLASENDNLKKISWELFKIVMAAGTGGGAVYAAKSMGLF